ncbi:putative disease resistance protein At3g14460 [Alnus glutinosa]|uniref:putative disease resistance protein At3g14460 n=1 Tax=Alnus glutinosa TaxID=3517 RepID=UPI002D77C9EC|nr:putative disease resistance protein At3g14460 [Alnus glutinosa]
MKEWENWSPNGGFPQLRELYIKNCPKLNKLAIGPSPSLKVLSIDGMDSVKNISNEFYGEDCSQPFRSLETLSFKNMKEWENWRSNREFTQLCKLYIENCPKLLGELPNHLPSLKDVEIQQCEGLQASFHLDNLRYRGNERPKRLVCRNEADFSLHMSNCLSRISEFTFPTERLIFYAEVVSFESSKEMTHLSSNVLELLRRLPSLRVIRFEDCPKLVSLGTEEVKEQPHVLPFPSTLREIHISNCNALESLPNAVMYNNTCLEKITIADCDSLKHFEIDGCQKLVFLVAEEVKEQPHVLAFPSTLREIKIRNCNALESLPNAAMYNNTCLEKIKIFRCDSLKRFAIGQLPQTLKRLEISFCDNMVILLGDDDTNSRSSSTSLLEYLDIKYCPSLKSLGIPMGELPATLKVFTIEGCEKLESIAESFHPNSSLEEIVINHCKSLKSLPMGIHTLSHLEKVEISGCPSLVSFPDRGSLPGNIKKLQIFELGLHDSILSITSLQHLTIWNSNNIEAFIDWGLHRLTSLKSLTIAVCPNLVSFPEKMLPASLTRLDILYFHDLKLLSSKGFRNLASLKMLYIKECENLTSFPEDDRLPPSLEILLIRDCPRLKESCKKDNEREWSKIAHIPCVKIDGRFIFDSEGLESNFDNEEFIYGR